MARRKNNFRKNSYYHIYNRGHNKRIVFKQQSDKSYFLRNLYYYAKKYNIEIDSYCIMRTHYHLIVNTKYNPQNLPKMMHSFSTKFCMYINKKYNMVGAVFQGRYKQRLIKDLDELIVMRLYLKQNPVKDGFVENPDDYKWMKLGGRTLVGSDP